MSEASSDTSALLRLPEEIASVQSQLQRLDEGIRTAKHNISAAQGHGKASRDEQRALQDDIQTALQAVATLELQNADLQALLAIKQEHSTTVHLKAEDVQVSQCVRSTYTPFKGL